MSKEKDEKIIINNVVYSVKGGCGKTTFSIALATAFDSIEENRKYNNDNTENVPSKSENYIENKVDLEQDSENSDMMSREVCLIDMDIQGTAMKNLLFGELSELGKEVNDSNLLADIFINDKTSSLTEKNKSYISKFAWIDKKTMTTKRKGFDVVLASPYEKDKKAFRGNSSLNYYPAVQFSTFREGLRVMLSVKDLHSKQNTPYKYVVFDMPPNSDGYSDAVFDCILNTKRMPDLSMGDDKYTYKNNLFIINTLDRSQRLATTDFIKEFLTTEYGAKIDNIYIVFNCLYLSYNYVQKGKTDIGVALDHWNVMYDRMKKDLQGVISDQFKEKIRFLVFNFNKQFFDISASVDGLFNIKSINGDDTSEKIKISFHEDFARDLCVEGIDWYGNRLEDDFSQNVLGLKKGKTP